MSGPTDNSAASPPPSIHGIELVDELRRTTETVVYRGRRSGREYAVRVLRERASVDSEAFDRFRRDAAVHARLDHPLIPSSYDVGISQGRPYVVDEYVDGEALPDWLDGDRLSESMAVVIAGAVAGALAQLHARGMVHGELRPENLVLTDAGEIKLANAAPVRNRGDNRLPGHAPSVETVPYAAPEQTSALERPVDGRADLYALGAVLYRCIAGRPPGRRGTDGRESPSLAEEVESVSPAFGAIVDRLLAAVPEERYQTASRLKADLDRLDALNERHAAGRALGLGTLEVDREEVEGDEFVGRTEELRRFEEIWKRVVRQGDPGVGGAVLVTGAAGCGKTRLLREVCGTVIDDGRRVLSGRCQQSARVPFEPLRAGLERYIERVEAIRDPGEASAADLLVEAAGPFRAVLGSVSPALGEVLDPVDEVMVPRDSHEVFFNAYASLLSRLSELVGGLLLWVDDAHWIDAATFEVLRKVGSRLEDHPLCLVGTARDGSAHREAVGRLRREVFDAAGRHLRVQPFGESEVGRLIGAQLGEPQVDGEIVEMFARESCGNPFHLEQQLQTLQDDGLLSPGWDSWTLDEEALGDLERARSASAWVERRLSKMAPATRRVLATGAVVGDAFSLEQIRAVCRGVSDASVDRAIRAGIEAQLLERRPDTRMYAFVHECIRETLLEESEDRRPRASEIRLRAAAYLDSLEDPTVSQVYERARHYIAGSADFREPRVVSALLEAGRLAVDEYAFEDAHEFLSKIEASDVRRQGGDPAEYYRMSGLACFRTERLEEAVAHLQSGLEHTDDELERARIRSRLAQVRIEALDEPAARRQASEAFDELGVRLPLRRWNSTVVRLLHIAWHWLVTAFVVWSGWGRGRAEGDERQATLVDLFDVGFRVGYYSRDKLFVLQSAVYVVRPAHYLGTSREYSVGFIIYAALMALLGRNGAAERYGDRALRNAERTADRQTLGFTRQMYGGIKAVCDSVDDAIEIEENLLETDPDWLDTATYHLVVIDLSVNYLFRGEARAGREVVERALRRLERRHGSLWQIFRVRLLATQACFTAMLGEFDEADRLRRRARELGEEIDRDRHVPWVATWGFLANERYQRGDVGERFDAIRREHEAFEISPERSVHQSKHYYLAQVYGLLERAQESSGDSSISELEEAVGELEGAATVRPLRCHLQVARGGLARLRGDWETAEDLLLEATERSREARNRWARFEALRELARLFAERRREARAREYAERAAAIAERAGWRHRADELERRFHSVDRATWM